MGRTRACERYFQRQQATTREVAGKEWLRTIQSPTAREIDEEGEDS